MPASYLARMKYLLLSLLLFTGVAHAQTAPAAGPYQYCALLVDDTYFTNPGRLLLDYGDKANPPVVSPELREDAVWVWKMGSVPAALNYLSGRGWECWNVNTVLSAVRAGVASYETRYLLRRRVQ